MAINPEEISRRRAERNARRAEKNARRRKWIFRLGIAGAVLVACLVLILYLSRDNAAPEIPPETVPSASEEAPDTAGKKPETTVIHIAAAGDLNVTDKVVQSGGPQYDYTNTFMDVAHLFGNADISVLNFEGNLVGAPYGSATASAPQELMEALNRAGVDMIQLANSYSIYKGISGLEDTINNVYAAGMEPLGVYANERAYNQGKGYTIREVDGVKIAFVAFTKGMDGMALPPGSENCVNLLFEDYESTYETIDRNGITKILEAAKKEKPDLIVALLHWGSEYKDTISYYQERIVSLLQENGVNAIIGTHSHYLHQMDYDAETGSFVAYSLGDFFGDAATAGSEYSVVLDLEVTKNNRTGETKITGFSYTPIFTAEIEGKSKVLRIYESVDAYKQNYMDKIPDDIYSDMEYALTRIEDRIHAGAAAEEEEE